MGAIADAVLKGNGEVLGVMPEELAKREILHKQITQTIITKGIQIVINFRHE